jgi:hypothetical protein
MTRIPAKMTTVLLALALGASVVAVNCSKGDAGTGTGTVRLALSLPNGTTLNSVDWKILSATAATLRSGTINTSDPAATPSVDTSCPASTGDTVQMTGTTSDGTSCSGTSLAFNVTAGGTTMVGLTITCGGGTPVQNNGSVIVNGTVVVGNNCPLLTSWVASPLTASTNGGQIDVAATASDADASDVLTYSWTATGGSFVSPTSASTKYTCSTPGGPQTLTITVSDNHQPTACTTFITIPVSCQPFNCGNGVLDPGEQCDPTAPNDPNRTRCSPTCLLQCGDGIVEAGEQCDPPRPGLCGTDCTFAGPGGVVCGDGIIAGPPFGTESCDPPNGSTCDAQCHSEEVDCNQGCQSCEQQSPNCDPSLTSVPGASNFGCAGFTGALHTNCIALIKCIRQNNCAVGDDPTACLCGPGVDPVACATGAVAPSGVCLAQYNAALAGGPSGTAFTLFTDPRSPIGISDNLWTCEVDGPCSSQCAFASCLPPQN